MAQYGHWFFYYITGGLLCPICFLLGVPGPFAFLGPFLNFAFSWAFIEFFGFSQPNHIILYPWGSWACYQPLTFFTFIILGLFSLFHIIYYPWFAFFFFFSLSFQAPLSPFIPLRPICLSHGLVIHYFCRLGLMGFLSIYQLFSICVVGLLLFTWTSKMAINNFFFFLSLYFYCISHPMLIVLFFRSVHWPLLLPQHQHQHVFIISKYLVCIWQKLKS